MIPPPRLRQWLPLAALASGLAVPAATQAQDAAAPTKLPDVVVTADQGRATDSVLPTATPIDTAFGYNKSIMDTPRSVDPLSRERLDDALVFDINELSRVSPNTYGPTVFGMTSLPTIRGQQGEIFQNNMLRLGGNNSYGLPISFNSVEALDIVKGPPSPVFGATQRVGGYIDLITKRASLDGTHGQIGYTFGSFGDNRYSLDVTTPLIKDELGIRLSYENIDAGSYYRNVKLQSQDIYLAIDWKPSDDFRYNFNGEFYDVAHYSDNAGINRPTQQLINNGLYITGQGISPVTGAVPGPNAVISPTGLVHLQRSDTFVDPMDYSNARVWNLQGEAIWKLNDNLTMHNLTFFQSLEKETVNQNSFREIIPYNYSLENRTQFVLNWGGDAPAQPEPSGKDAKNVTGKDGKRVTPDAATIPDERFTTVFGFDFRWDHGVGLSQFNTEADAPNDLTKSLKKTRVPNSVVQSLTSAHAAPGSHGFLVSPGGTYDTNGDGIADVFGNGDVNDTVTRQYGLFLQQDLKLTDWLSFDFGGRGDLFQISEVDPAPPPHMKAASDDTTFGEGSGNASLILKPSKQLSFYGTYSYTQSTNNALGGGSALNGNNSLDTSNAHIGSQLIEVGAKLSMLDDTLFAQAALFDQTLSIHNHDGTASKLKVPGAEVSLTYQPDKHFYASFGAAYLDARFDHSGTSQETNDVHDAFDNSRPGIIHGTGIGSPSFTAYPPGDYRFPGIPQYNINASVSYKLECGLGARINGFWTSEQNLDVQGHVKIPNQITLNAGVFYNWSNWSVSFDVLNFTNEKNWTTVFNGYFGATDVMPELPVRFLASVKYRF